MGAESLENMSKNELLRSNIIEELFPRKRRMDVNKNWFLMGKKVFKDLLKLSVAGPKDYTHLDIGNEAIRMTLFGATRRGKTAILRRLMDLAYVNDFHVIFLTDIKNEMRSSKRPQHQEFRKFMHENDIAQGLPVKVYRPLFFSTFFNEKLPEDNEYFSISSEDMTINEFIGCLGFDKNQTQNQANVVSMYWQNTKNMKELEYELEESAEKRSTKDAILRSMRPLNQYKVFTEPSTDFIQDLVDKKVVVFNVQKFRDIDIKGIPNPIQFYIKIIQRKIVEAKQAGRLKKRVLIIMDEAPVFLSDPNSLIFKETKNIVDVQAYLGIYAIFASQTVNYLKEASFILNQSRYIMFPDNFSIDDAKTLLQYIQKYDFHPFWKRDLSLALKAMRSDSRGRVWAVLDTQKKTVECFRAYMSLSEHMRTKM